MTRHRHPWIKLSTAALLAAALVGCSGQSNHEKWKAQANDRYLNVRSGLMLDMAQQQFETGQLDVAHKTIEDALQLDPGNPELYTLAGRIALERGRLERSYRLLDKALDARVERLTSDKARRAAARAAANGEDPQQARAQARAEARGQSQSQGEGQQSGESQANAGPTAIQPDLPDPLYYQGVILQRWQKYQQAYDKYNRAYELAPDDPAYLLAASEMLVAMDQTTRAAALLSSKLDYFDQNAGIRTGLGHIYTMRNQHDQAASMFHQAAMLAPDNPQLNENRATALLQAGKPAEAAQQLRVVLKNPDMKDRQDLRRLLGRAELQAGNPSAAREIFAELTRRDPAGVSDWVQRGELAWRADDLGGTLMAANRVINLAPQRHEGYLLAGLVWHKRGRLDDALHMFDQAADRVPDSAMPLILRGIALQRADRPAAAARAYQRALQRNPDDGRAQRLLDSVAGVSP